MKYKKIKCNNYDVYLIKTNKFKTINISVVLNSSYKKDQITKEKFLSEFLVNSYNKAKDEVSMSKEYMNLYEPRISINDMFTDILHKVYDVTFLNEKYTEKGMNKKTIDFFFEIMFNPNEKNGSLEEKNFNIIKERMKTWYKLDKEDSSTMAYYDSLSYIEDNIPIRIDVRGNEEDLNKIDNKELYDYYFNRLKDSMFTVFVVGDYTDEIIECIKSNLNKRVNKNNYSFTKEYKIKDVVKEREIINKTDFNQSIVYIYYKIIGMTERERNYVLPIFNSILGGSSSKLFNNVREKESLAYYAYSGFYKLSNIFYMYAGISKDNYNKCIKLMKKQLEEIKKGNISDNEISGAKEFINSNILKTDDNINSISNSLKEKVFFDSPFYDEKKEIFMSVSKNEIIELAKKLNLDFVYLLKGVK